MYVDYFVIHLMIGVFLDDWLVIVAEKLLIRDQLVSKPVVAEVEAV